MSSLPRSSAPVALGGSAMPGRSHSLATPAFAPTSSPVRTVSLPENPDPGRAESSHELEEPAADGDSVVFQGRVLDPDGKPFAGAKVYLHFFRDTMGPKLLEPRATTGTDGRFRFTVAKAHFQRDEIFVPWNYTPVVAVAEGFGLGVSDSDEPRSSATALARVDDLRLPEGLVPSLAETRLAGSTEADEGLGAFVRRSLVDFYASAQRVSELVARSTASSSESYPDDPLGERLRTVAQLLKAGLGAQVSTRCSRATTRTPGSSRRTDRLLRMLSSALKSFFDDLAAAKLADRVLVLGFSEFGRRVAENSSVGTDHGSAGLVLLAGQGVQGGIHGKVPSLTDLPDGDPR